jgi:glutamine phosphoribosylpyrophosphate amidotransferase
MCGLTALTTPSFTAAQLNLLQAVFYESTVRGLHAFGMAYGKPGDNLNVLRSHSMSEILHKFDDTIGYYLGRPLVFIGHARYDTSGDWRVLENNQPLVHCVASHVVTNQHLLAFNGVIRMTTKQEYEKEFARQYPVDNDGYIALDILANGLASNTLLYKLLSEPVVSFAGFYYSPSRNFAIRNDRRPLWLTKLPGNAYLFHSTIDVLVRAGVRHYPNTFPLEPMTEVPLWQTA